MAEDELADQYLANELSEKDRDSFEKHYLLVPEHRQKLRFARTLKRYAGHSTEKSPATIVGSGKSASFPKKRHLLSFLPIENPIAAYSLAAVALFTVVGASGLLLNSWISAPQTSGKVVALSLTPGLIRQDGEIKSFAIPADTGSVQLNLELTSADYPAYRAELLTADLDSLLINENLKPESVAGGRIVTFTVPARLFKRDDYRVKLAGRRADGVYEDAANYVLRIVN